MKKTLLVLSITLLGTFLSSNVMGQVVNNDLSLGLDEVTMLATTATPVSLKLAPQVAGEAILSSVSDDSKRLQISSIITEVSGSPVLHTIKASLLAGTAVPAGTYLNLQAIVPAVVSGTSGGLLGTSANDVKLPMVPGSAVNIVTGIGSCFSGKDITNGYTLKYTWGVDLAGNYADIRATAGTTVTVVLTLSGAQ